MKKLPKNAFFNRVRKHSATYFYRKTTPPALDNSGCLLYPISSCFERCYCRVVWGGYHPQLTPSFLGGVAEPAPGVSVPLEMASRLWLF